MIGRMKALTPQLEKAIAIGYEQRDRDNMAPTISYFERLLEENPDHPVLVYEVARAYDTAGDEERARRCMNARSSSGWTASGFGDVRASTAAHSAGLGCSTIPSQCWSAPVVSSPTPTLRCV
jgi:hypothetical protein